MGTGSNATKTTGGGHGQYFSWHQDSTYSGFSGDDAVTFWVAFGPVTEEMGPLQYRVGTHALGQLRHEERPEERAAGNMLAFGQTIPPSGSGSDSAKAAATATTIVRATTTSTATATTPAAWDDDTAFPIAVAAPLAPGEASVHNFSLVHRRGKLDSASFLRNICHQNIFVYLHSAHLYFLCQSLNIKRHTL